MPPVTTTPRSTLSYTPGWYEGTQDHLLTPSHFSARALYCTLTKNLL